MGISLSKGQKINLSKTAPGLNEIHVGLGWDEASSGKSGGGLFGMLKSVVSSQAIDCDASVLLLNSQGKLQSPKDIIYFGRLRSEDGSIQHMGDNLTGAGSGDDEVINVRLNQVSPHVNRILFVVNIYQAQSRNQHFGMINNAFIRVVDKSTGEEIARYNLSDNYNGYINLFVGELVKENGSWEFKALGDGGNFPGLGEIERHYS